jgi:hypothetical protein
MESTAPLSTAVGELTGIARRQRANHNQLMADAFLSGQKAKTRGWSRTSPFYESEMQDAFFYGGYDGKTVKQVGEELALTVGG